MTTRVFIAVLAASIVFATLGAVVAYVATNDDGDTVTRTEVVTTTP